MPRKSAWPQGDKETATLRGGSAEPDAKASNLLRLRRIEARSAVWQKMVEEDRRCPDILMQVASVQEALKGVSRELVRNHLERCALQAITGQRATSPRRRRRVARRLVQACRLAVVFSTVDSARGNDGNHDHHHHGSAPAPDTAKDPVCGMSVSAPNIRAAGPRTTTVSRTTSAGQSAESVFSRIPKNISVPRALYRQRRPLKHHRSSNNRRTDVRLPDGSGGA